MFQEYRDKKLYDEIIYASGVDLLLRWGRAHLFDFENTAALDRIAEKVAQMTDDDTFSDDIEQGLTALENSVAQVLSFFDTHPYFTMDSELAEDVPVAMEILDHTVFLAEASDTLPQGNLLSESARERIKLVLEKATVTHAPSGMRLIPLNDWRCRMMSAIPEAHRYLFPWYSNWASEPPETIDLLIDNWRLIETGNAQDTPIDPATLEMLLVELKNDEDLLAFILDQVKIGEIIPKAIASSIALRLYIASQKEAANYAVPPEVSRKGLVACADRLIKNRLKKAHSPADRLEGDFLAAFCGPMISDQKRMDLFSRVEEELRGFDRNQISPGSILAALADWADNGNLPGKKIAEIVFPKWLEDLSNIAAAVVSPIKDMDALPSFLKTIDALASWVPETAEEGGGVGIVERLKSWISPEVRMSAMVLQDQTLAAPSGETEPSDITYFSDKGNIIDLPMNYKREEKLFLAGRQKGSNEFEDFREKFLEKTVFHWNAVVKKAGEKEEWLNAKAEKSKKPPLAKPMGPFEYVVVCISPKSEIVEKATAGESLTDEEKKQIVFLRYLPEDHK